MKCKHEIVDEFLGRARWCVHCGALSLKRWQGTKWANSPWFSPTAKQSAEGFINFATAWSSFRPSEMEEFGEQ